MTEHTPTPWHTGSADHTELVMGFRDNREVIIAETDPASDMAVAEADVALIVQAVNSHDDLQATISRLTAERDAARAAALEEAAQAADEYHDEAWGHSAEQAAAKNIADAIRALATPAVSDAQQGGRANA